MLGDFNSAHIEWKHSISKDNICTQLLNFSILNGLEQLVDFETRDKAVLDLLFTNQKSLITNIYAGDKFSDHVSVFFSLKTKLSNRTNKTFAYNFFKADFVSINNVLACTDFFELFRGKTLKNVTKFY